MQSIIITGAGGGIGRACAQTFLDMGWNVGLVGRNAKTFSELAAHKNAFSMPCDVTKESEVETAFDGAMAQWGRIDALFNNAGIAALGCIFDDVSVDDFRRSMDVNVTGSFICARAAFKHMRAQSPQGGRIINNGSISAHVPRWGSAPYTSSKHAITGLTKSISLDGRPFNIACSQIDIGNALTDMVAPMQAGVPQANGSLATEPVMDVQHVASSVVHMANLPLDANVQFMTVMATAMPYIGRG